MSYTPLHLFHEDVTVGQQWESLGRTITEADVVNYAGLSGDFNPMHVDDQYATGTHYQRRMAHGLLVLAIGSGLAVWAPPMRTLALVCVRDWQFKEAVFLGDTIRVRTTLIEKEEKGRGRRALCTWKREIINQAGVVVQEGITQTLVLGRAGVADSGA
jgi:acyl dehydratase